MIRDYQLYPGLKDKAEALINQLVNMDLDFSTRFDELVLAKLAVAVQALAPLVAASDWPLFEDDVYFWVAKQSLSRPACIIEDIRSHIDVIGRHLPLDPSAPEAKRLNWVIETLRAIPGAPTEKPAAAALKKVATIIDVLEQRPPGQWVNREIRKLSNARYVLADVAATCRQPFDDQLELAYHLDRYLEILFERDLRTMNEACIAGLTIARDALADIANGHNRPNASTSHEARSPTIRTWARAYGYQVAERGRLSSAVIERYEREVGHGGHVGMEHFEDEARDV